MPLRLLELTLPDSEKEALLTSLQEQTVIQVWSGPTTDQLVSIRVLLDAEHVEAVTDMLDSKFGSQTGFRLILLSVEATIPRIEVTEPNNPEEVEKEVQEGESGTRISREELYEDLVEASRLTTVYAVMVILSTVVAAIGLIRSDVAIIIGAMVIAPLLGPNVALSLACTLGDPDLAQRSLKTIGAGIILAFIVSFILGATLKFDPSTHELVMRTSAGFGDIIIALAAGAAGSLAFTTGVPAVLVGVMVAVALLPPLTATGLLAGADHWVAAGGAFTLLITNITCINLAAVATFLIQKVRPRTWWEEEQAKKATRIAVATWVVILLLLLCIMLLKHVRGV